MMVFNIKKCQDDPRDKNDPSKLKCADAKTKIDPYLRKITVEAWAI